MFAVGGNSLGGDLKGIKVYLEKIELNEGFVCMVSGVKIEVPRDHTCGCADVLDSLTAMGIRGIVFSSEAHTLPGLNSIYVGIPLSNSLTLGKFRCLLKGYELKMCEEVFE